MALTHAKRSAQVVKQLEGMNTVAVLQNPVFGYVNVCVTRLQTMRTIVSTVSVFVSDVCDCFHYCVR